MNKITLKKIDNDDKDMDDDQMTDDEQLVHQQKHCLKELRLSIEAFVGKHKQKKGGKFKKKFAPKITVEKK